MMPRNDMDTASANSTSRTTWPAELPEDPQPGSDDEALVLAAFTDLLNQGAESMEASKLREAYKGHPQLARMMDAVFQLKSELDKRKNREPHG